MNATRAQRAGFTLLEVVVALALGAVLLAAVTRLVVHAQRAHAAITQAADRSAVRELPLALLRRDLANRPAGGGLALNADALAFTTLNALQTPRCAARCAVNVRYMVQSDADGVRIRRSESELGADPPDTAGVVLADLLAAAEFRVSDGRQWYPAWPLSVPRPAWALRLRITYPDGTVDQADVHLRAFEWSGRDE